MNTYRTSEIANLTGLHPNTIRLYEEIGFLTKPRRLPNGYRVYTDLHLGQVRLIRLALRAEVLQNGLRKVAVGIIRLSAEGRFCEAEGQTRFYIEQIESETRFAKSAVESVESILKNREPPKAPPKNRSEAAAALGVTVDTLRNWELNGLVSIRRMHNGYRVYEAEDMERLLIIRTLRCANYSLSSILRLMGRLAQPCAVCVTDTLNTPDENEEIVSVCDHLLAALAGAKENAMEMLASLECMKKITTLQ